MKSGIVWVFIPFLNDRLSLAKTRLSSRNELRLLHACLNVIPKSYNDILFFRNGIIPFLNNYIPFATFVKYLKLVIWAIAALV